MNTKHLPWDRFRSLTCVPVSPRQQSAILFVALYMPTAERLATIATAAADFDVGLLQARRRTLK